MIQQKTCKMNFLKAQNDKFSCMEPVRLVAAFFCLQPQPEPTQFGPNRSRLRNLGLRGAGATQKVAAPQHCFLSYIFFVNLYIFVYCTDVDCVLCDPPDDLPLLHPGHPQHSHLPRCQGDGAYYYSSQQFYNHTRRINTEEKSNKESFKHKFLFQELIRTLLNLEQLF